VQRWLIGLPVAAACLLVGPVGASANSALRRFSGISLFDRTGRVRMKKGQPGDTVQLGVPWAWNNDSAQRDETRFGEISAVQAGGAGWHLNRINYFTLGYDVTLAPAYGSVARGPGTTPGNRSPAVDGLGRPSCRRPRRIGLTAAGASRQARFNCGRPDSTTNEARVTRGAPGLVTKGTVR
jgi:hypothetical protein